MKTRVSLKYFVNDCCWVLVVYIVLKKEKFHVLFCLILTLFTLGKIIFNSASLREIFLISGKDMRHLLKYNIIYD